MKTRQRILVAASTAACAALLLAGCSAEKAAEPAASAPPKVAEASASPTASARTVPISCAGLNLSLGAQLEGGALGQCVSAALSSYGSGRMQLTADTFGEVEFTYNPSYSFSAHLEGPSGPISMRYVDGEMWVDSGTGPVKGDPNSEDPAEQLVAVTGELYRFYSDLQQTAELIAAQPAWTVDSARDQVTTPGGDTIESYKIVSDGAFSWKGMPVSEFILWFGDDWVPVGTQATVDFLGTSGTHTQHFYDLGAPITIAPLS